MVVSKVNLSDKVSVPTNEKYMPDPVAYYGFLKRKMEQIEEAFTKRKTTYIKAESGFYKIGVEIIVTGMWYIGMTIIYPYARINIEKIPKQTYEKAKKNIKFKKISLEKLIELWEHQFSYDAGGF